MKLSNLLAKAGKSTFWLWTLNIILWKKVPFNNPHKIKIIKIENGGLVLLLPYKRKNLNHIKSIHACALATLCEYISGLALMSSISEKEYRIILKNIHMTYHYQAKMDVVASFSLPDGFIKNEIIEPLQVSGSVMKELIVEAYDSTKNHICTGKINWQIKKWEKVKTKL